jgi:hypothetical protein
MMTPTQPAATGEAQSRWWPSKYGADDQAGALNEITPGKVLEAVSLVRQGLVYDPGARAAPGHPGVPGPDLPSVPDHQLPPHQPAPPFAVPQLLNTRHGVVVVENLRLADAARDHVHEFLLVISHAKLRGATGAWVAPLSIV